MKTKLLLLILISSITISYGQRNADDCMDFKKRRHIKNSHHNNSSNNFKKWIKSPDGIIKISLSDVSSLGMSESTYNVEETYDSEGNLISKSEERTGGIKYFLGDYDGFSGAIAYERKIGKKSTLQIEMGYTYFRKISFLDTVFYNYPTIDITQYYSDYKKSQNGNLESWNEYYYDIVKSNNFSIACDYRFYIRKLYRKSYLSPFIKCYIGKNKYFDFDSNPNNINYAFTQKNMMLNLGIKYGYQWIINKHFVINPSVGLGYLKGFESKRNYFHLEADDAGLKYKYPNSIALQNKYRLGYFFGLSIGYKF